MPAMKSSEVLYLFGNRKPHEGYAKTLLTTILGADLHTLDEEGIESAQRAASLAQILLQKEVLSRAGIKIRQRWDRNGPGVKRLQFGSWVLDRGPSSGLDHLYRLVTPRGETIYVSEPYYLSTDATQWFTELEQTGWTVDIDPSRAVYFPGRTMAIWFRRRQ